MNEARAGAPPEQHRAWMEENLEKYLETMQAWDQAVARGIAPYPLLLDALEQITLVWVNALDAGDERMEREAEQMTHALRKLILTIMSSGGGPRECMGWWNSYKGSCCQGAL